MNSTLPIINISRNLPRTAKMEGALTKVGTESVPDNIETFAKIKSRDRDQIIEVLGALGIGEFEANLRTGQVSFTPQLSRLFGFSDDRLPSIDEIRARYHPDDQKRVEAETAAALENPSIGFIRNRFRVLQAQGRVRVLEARGMIYREENGRATRSVGLMFDVTEDEETAQALESHWQRIEQALTNTALVVFQQDLDLRYEWINNAKLGFEAFSVIGKTDAELMDAEFAVPLEALKRKVIETGHAMRSEVTTMGSEGRARYDLYIEPRRDGEGKIVGITCAAIELDETASAGTEESSPDSTLRDRDLILNRMNPRAYAIAQGQAPFTVCSASLFRKLNSFEKISSQSMPMLCQLESSRLFAESKSQINIERSLRDDSSLMLGSGWAYECRYLSNGERQLLRVFIPGDVIRANPYSDDVYYSITDCIFCKIQERALTEFVRSDPLLDRAYLAMKAADAALLEERVVNLGKRRAIARVAHLLLELDTRLSRIGESDGGGYRCPLSQELIGDALGLTNVHVSRMLKELRKRGCVTFVRGFVKFDNKKRLIEIAEDNQASASGGR